MTSLISSGSPTDAVVVGAGPNGLAAANALAEAGRSVVVIEAEETIGGGCRSAELTLPGFLHDVCSAIHLLAVASPFFRTLPLASYGLKFIQPPAALAHPLDDGTAALLTQSIDDTAASLGKDGAAYKQLFEPLVADFEVLAAQLLRPLRLPRHPIALARFGLPALRSAQNLALSSFSQPRAKALFAGMAAHSIRDLERPATAALGLVLALFGHAAGWPIAQGGSQQITDALGAHLRSLGGTIQTGTTVTSLDIVEEANAVLFDVTPHQFLAIAGDHVPPCFRQQLGRYRKGWGVFKMDWALDGPVPWIADGCSEAGTLHLGGTMEEIVAAEHDVALNRHPERPFVLVAQQSLFDATRSPAGQQTLWGYCHVPNGSTVDMTERIEAQIERFAPGFTEQILARSVTSPLDLERYNANYVGGDINGGVQDLRQIFTRPTPRLDPY